MGKVVFTEWCQSSSQVALLDRKTFILCGASLGLYPLALHFCGPLVVLSLSPLIVVFARLERGRDVALVSLLFGILAAFFVQHTLWVVSLPGTALLSVYQGFLWIPMAFAVRYSRIQLRIPMAISWPLIWCAGEILRSLGPVGTPFGALAVPKTTCLWMLQIADLGGASIAAFPLAALQGWFADMLLLWKRHDIRGFRFLRVSWREPVKAGAAFVVLIWGFVGAYGVSRLSVVESRMESGPQVGIVATDVLTLPGGEAAYDDRLLLEKLQAHSEELVEESPEIELIVWPEGMLSTLIPNLAFVETNFEPRMAPVIAKKTGLSRTDPDIKLNWDWMRKRAGEEAQQFQSWVDELGVAVLVGMETWSPAPIEFDEPFLLQNSGVHFKPHVGQDAKVQSKVRLYPLGEYLPFENSILGRALRLALGEPKSNYFAGTERSRYSFGDEGPNYAVALCSELTFDHLFGLMRETPAVSKPYQVVINLANEGLFQRNGMPEIFAFCAVLRAIENRVTVVRSSNSGVSGFWSPTGASYGIVTNARGQTPSGMGAAEREAVAKVMRFRKQYQRQIAINPALRETLSRLIDGVDQIRSAAAVEGVSSGPVYSVVERTIFSSYGHLVKAVLIGILVLFNLMPLLRWCRDRRIRRA